MELLRSIERSSNRVMEENRVCCMYLCRGPPFGPPKKYSGANDVISAILNVLNFFRMLCNIGFFECRESLLWTVVDKLII